MTDTGKDSWPELVGVEGNVAAAIIEQENPQVDAIVLRLDEMTDMSIRCERVKVRVDDRGFVVETPRVG